MCVFSRIYGMTNSNKSDSIKKPWRLMLRFKIKKSARVEIRILEIMRIIHKK